ncbi:hypothetical protein GQ457_07G005640 [Hibiscus cannabinus]
MIGSEHGPKATMDIRADCSSKDFESIKAGDTRTSDDRKEMQELRNQILEMMNQMNALAEEKGSSESREDSNKNQNATLDGQSSTIEQGSSIKYHSSNPFVIHINQPVGGIFESSFEEVVAGSEKAWEASNVKKHDPIPLKYIELLSMLVDRNLVTPVQSVPKGPPYPKAHNVRAGCSYHSGSFGHTTENCWPLKNKVQNLIKAGVLSFEDGRPQFYNRPMSTQDTKLKKGKYSGQDSNANVRPATGGWRTEAKGHHFDPIPISYKELYPQLLKAQLVGPIFVKPLQPPYPDWYDRRVQAILDCGKWDFRIGGRPNTQECHPVELESEAKDNGAQGKECSSEYNRLKQERDVLKAEIKSLQEVFHELCSIFKSIGLGNTCEEWKNNALLLKNKSEQMKGRNWASESRAKQLAQNLKETESRCDILQSELEKSLAVNKILRTSLQHCKDESNAFQSDNAALKEQVNELKASLHKSEIRVQVSEEFAINKAVELTSKLQKAKHEIQKRDEDMNIALGQAREVAQHLAHLLEKIQNCPKIHLTMFCRKMEGYLKDEDLLIHCFHDSLVGPAAIWYNRLSKDQVQKWGDLVRAFLEQYKYALNLAPSRQLLQSIEMRLDESFKEYALRWRNIAAQVQPHITENEMTPLFHATLPPPFFDMMIERSESSFVDFMTIGERIECGIHMGRLGPKSSGQANQEVEDDRKVCKNHFLGFDGHKRKRRVDHSESPRKNLRTSPNLEIFGIPISDLLPHLVEGQYITPRPMKVTPDLTAHNFDPESTCDFHMGAPGHSTRKCRPLMDEIKKLVNNGVLTQDLIQQWKAKKVGQVCIVLKGAE